MSKSDNKQPILMRVEPSLYLTSEEVQTLTADDEQILVDLGAQKGMLAQLRKRARTPGLNIRLDFHLQSVVVEDEAHQVRGAGARPRVSVN